jgi:CspA family cold shock protein
MAKGKIKNLIKDRGYGFIEAEDGESIFFHQTAVDGAEFESLQEGQAVEYETESSPKGPRAVSVKVTEQ